MQLTNKQMLIVKEILNRCLEREQVWCFGSRANKKAAKYSDLDLLIKGDKVLSLDTLSHLSEAFADSLLPFKVDIID